MGGFNSSRFPAARIPVYHPLLSARPMVKIGESFPPEHFFKVVIGIWLVVQLGVMLTLRVRRRKQGVADKQD